MICDPQSLAVERNMRTSRRERHGRNRFTSEVRWWGITTSYWAMTSPSPWGDLTITSSLLFVVAQLQRCRPDHVTLLLNSWSTITLPSTTADSWCTTADVVPVYYNWRDPCIKTRAHLIPTLFACQQRLGLRLRSPPPIYKTIKVILDELNELKDKLFEVFGLRLMFTYSFSPLMCHTFIVKRHS